MVKILTDCRAFNHAPRCWILLLTLHYSTRHWVSSSKCVLSVYTFRKPTMFQDVIDSDTKEIVSEYVAHDSSECASNPSRFRQKFQRIVQQERGENFISKLHQGKLDIIPWPVIESSRFYDLFGGLKNRFDRQPITHLHAGAFLTVLKMLMAKLKVCSLVISMLSR